MRQGNFGDYKNLGEGLNELRIHYGPGYRIYFSQLDDIIIVLLCGGIKKSQGQDTKKAKEFWQDFKNRNL